MSETPQLHAAWEEAADTYIRYDRFLHFRDGQDLASHLRIDKRVTSAYCDFHLTRADELRILMFISDTNARC